MENPTLFDVFEVCEKSESETVCKKCNHTKTQVLVCGTCLAWTEAKRDKEIKELEQEIEALRETIRWHIKKEKEWKRLDSEKKF